MVESFYLLLIVACLLAILCFLLSSFFEIAIVLLSLPNLYVNSVSLEIYPDSSFPYKHSVTSGE